MLKIGADFDASVQPKDILLQLTFYGRSSISLAEFQYALGNLVAYTAIDISYAELVTAIATVLQRASRLENMVGKP